MDPVSLIVSALELGANAGIKEAFSEAGKDAYNKLKELIRTKYPDVDKSVARLGEHQGSEAQREVVAEELQRAAAGDDRDLRALAQALIEAVPKETEEKVRAIGIDLQGVKLANVNLKDFTVKDGIGVRMRDSVAGDLNVDNLYVEHSGGDAPKKA